MKLAGISNSGWTFTEERLKQLNIMFYTIEKLEYQSYSYKDIQAAIENENNIINSSKIRMFFPFLKKCGIITYDNKIIDTHNFLTDLGRKFKLYLEIHEFISEKMNNDLKINKLDENIIKEFIYIFLKNLTNDNDIYKIITKILLEKNNISYYEFFIITNSFNKNIHDINYILSQMDTLNTENIEIEKHKNAWQYLMNLFEESGLVKIEKQTAIILSSQKLKVENLLKGE